MKLDEVLKSVLPWKEEPLANASWNKQYSFIYKFRDYDDVIRVLFSCQPESKNRVHIMFISNKSGTDIANRNHGMYKIISTVLDIVRHFDMVRSPSEYHFTAEEPSRIKLYDRISNTMERELKFHRRPSKKGTYSLYKEY